MLFCPRLVAFLSGDLHVIYQTRETGYPNKKRKKLKLINNDAERSIFDEIRGVWIADETLSRVFDISSQSKQKLRSKRRSKIVKIYANKTGYPNLLHDCDFLCFNLI